MSQFIGLWMTVPSKHQNFDEYCKASGLPADFTEQFRNDESTVEFKQDGDTWSCHFVSSVAPAKTFVFKSGEEVETDFMGKGVKFTITIESDTKMTEIEKNEMMDWRPVKITREIVDGKMICTHDLDGVVMTSEMIRC